MNEHTKKYGYSKNFGLDFTLISILLGNDYLPKINFCDLTKMWNTYKLWVSEYKTGLIDENLNINKEFFTKLLNGIITNTKYHFINKFTINSFNMPLYSNYMEGVLWCLNMYKNGICNRYNYMYQSDDTPHPLGLILHMNLNQDILKFKDENYGGLDKNLYAILVLPKKTINLINIKYHDFAKKYENVLCEEEMCETCINLHIKKNKYTREDEEYKEISNELKCHKAEHRHIDMDDIENISTDFTKIFY